MSERGDYWARVREEVPDNPFERAIVELTGGGWSWAAGRGILRTASGSAPTLAAAAAAARAAVEKQIKRDERDSWRELDLG